MKYGISIPLWRTQMPAFHKVAEHLGIPPPDLLAVAAMAYLVQFDTKEELFRRLEAAINHFAIKGEPVRLQFPLDWPDSLSPDEPSKAERLGGFA